MQGAGRAGLGAVLLVGALVVGSAAGGASAGGGSAPPGGARAGGASPGDPAPVVVTDRGPVRGVAADGVRRFSRIPYAAPPVGALRFAPPQPSAAWSDPIDGSTPGPPCPQVVPVVDRAEGDEDCLLVNVITPDPPPTRPAPVLVWLHGGSFVVGSASYDDPSRLVAREGVVVVAVGSRLGALGFLAHPALRAEHPRGGSGNMALEDQRAAFRWVRRNAAAFGGDPERVTAWGQSAGSIDICLHLVSPGARRLFDRAVLQSGGCASRWPTRREAEAQGEDVAHRLGCDVAPGGGAATGPDVLACLRAVPVPALLRAIDSPVSFLSSRTGFWGPTADGVVVPRSPVGVLRTGRFDRIPVLLGATRDEGRIFVALSGSVGPDAITEEQWPAAVDELFGADVGPAVRRQYPLADFPDPGAALGQAAGDAVLTCGVRRLAGLLAPRAPVFLYEYDHEPNPFVLPTPGIDLGAPHGAELPYVTGGPTAESGAFTFTPEEAALAATVGRSWARFASAADPSTRALAWPRLRGVDGRYVALDTPPVTRRAMKRDECRFWARSGWRIEDLAP